MRKEPLFSQDKRGTPLKTTRSFINQFSNSERKMLKADEEPFNID
jgi:hypothetical protein